MYKDLLLGIYYIISCPIKVQELCKSYLKYEPTTKPESHFLVLILFY